MKYTKIKKYKYKLHESETFRTPIKGIEYDCDYFTLKPTGYLVVYNGYCWDGPSGVTIDTKPFIAVSLPHDVAYQMIREGILNIKDHKELADRYLQTLGQEYGMSRFRTWYVYHAVRKFGKSSCISDVITVNKK